MEKNEEGYFASPWLSFLQEFVICGGGGGREVLRKAQKANSQIPPKTRRHVWRMNPL